jgi:DNA-binding transcriptional LysR family regulator
LVLTEPGEEFYKAVSDVFKRVAVGLACMNEYRDTPKGPLKITTSVAFGSGWLTSRINKFHLLYPDISVSLLLVDNVELDLFLRQAEVAIRFARQTHPNLIQRHLMSIRYRIFASKDYLTRHGTPTKPEDLDHHDIVVYGEDLPGPVTDLDWLLEAGAPAGTRREPTLRVNSVYAIYRAVRSGLGIGALPHYLSDEAPDLVEILPELEGPRMDAFLVYPEELRHSRRIAAVRDFLVKEASEYSKQESHPRPEPENKVARAKRGTAAASSQRAK